MNSQDFQNICATLENKYDEHRLTDQDVDAFADVISNILDRDDLRDDSTDYASLSNRVSHDYENDIAMNPLLARMYELCRMYENFRQRPLTEMERKEEQMERGKKRRVKCPALLTVTASGESIASIWFEDLADADGIMDKIAGMSTKLVGVSKDYDNDDKNAIEQKILKSFAAIGGAFEQYDKNSIMEAASIINEVPTIEAGTDDENVGIIGIGKAGIERNRARGGVEVKISLEDENVRMDAYTVYGKQFIENLIGKQIDMHDLQELHDDDIEFTLREAERARDDWHYRIGSTFLIPGSKNLVGTKKPVPVGNIGKLSEQKTL